MESWLEQVVAWHDFYVIVGSAGAGLTGLMFVVVSLGQRTFAESRDTGVRAFVTPTVVFFTSVLVIAAAMTVPHLGSSTTALLLTAGSLAVLGYLLTRGTHRMWRTSNLDRPDWWWYFGLPVLSYGAMIVGATLTWRRDERGLDVVAAATIALLVVGIRN